MSQSFQASQQQGGQMVTSQPQGASGGQIPDLLRIGSIPSNTQIEVETAILEPVTQSQTHCKFVLQNKGLLHSHSKLEFEFESPSDGDVPDNAICATLPVGIGIHALIQRATLRVGTKTICEIDDYNFYQAYRTAFLSPEAEIEREQYLTGRNGNCLQFDYINAQVNPLASYAWGSPTQSNTSANGLMLANGKDMDVNVPAPNVDGASQRPELDEVRLTRASAAVTPDQDKCPTWQIAISDLFPFLKFNQLPLYMMKEPVNLELVFSKAGTLAAVSCDRACHEVGSFPVVNIRAASTRMIADHIYYPQEMMEAYANANRSLQFQYTDYRLSKFSVSTASLASTGIRNVGGAGRIISKIIWGIQDSDINSHFIQGKYAAISPNRDYTNATPWTANSQGQATFNVKMNEQFLFPVDVTNTARHFHNVVQAEGSVPFLSRETYSKEGISLAHGVYNPRVMTAGGGALDNFGSSIAWNKVLPANQGVGGQYPGTQFWNCMRLNRGERVNSRGIELYFKQDVDAIGAHSVQRVWLETLRTATLQDGELNAFYA
jgi:hypothetical protein